MSRKKVGIALGSGAARGLAHIGVLQVLKEEGIPIDVIAGTSSGAAIGALFARTRDTAAMEKLALELSRKRMTPLLDLSLPKTGFITGKKVKEFLKSACGGNISFGDLQIPFACIATDIITGEEVVLNRGSVIEAIRASISIPVIFTAVEMDGRYLVDGGLVNPVPTDTVRNMGADFVIAVNVIPDARQIAHWVNREGGNGAKKLSLINIIMQSMYIGIYSTVKSCLQNADVVIEPEVANIRYGDFHHAQECIFKGRQAAAKAIPEIRSQLKLGKRTTLTGKPGVS